MFRVDAHPRHCSGFPSCHDDDVLDAPLNPTQKLHIQVHHKARIWGFEEAERRRPGLVFLALVWTVQERDGQWVTWAGWARRGA